MSSVLDDRDAYKASPYFTKPEFSEYAYFYITISLCTLFFIFLIVLNATLGCCSRYSAYWSDRHTGNRWIISLWTSTPHKQPSLDYTELNYVVEQGPQETYSYPPPQVEISHQYSGSSEYLELQQQKRESAI